MVNNAAILGTVNTERSETEQSSLCVILESCFWSFESEEVDQEP